MSSFSPSPAELALVSQIFTAADPQKLGIVTGDAAVKVFAGAKLPPTVLGEVWAIADKENNGFLTRKGVAIALRLIGHAQKGEAVNEALLSKPAPLAQIDGVTQQSTGPGPIPSSPTPSKTLPGLPPLTIQDKSKFAKLFISCGPVAGLLSGEKARDVFVKSKLPFEKLSVIWYLADTQDRGSLDQTDFTIAMYLIQACMSNQLSTLPTTLPPALYEQAGGRAPQGVTSNATGTSGSFSPALTGVFPNTGTGSSTPVQAQYTGQSQPLRTQTTGMTPKQNLPLPSRSTAQNTSGTFATSVFPATQNWDVTTEEKANADRFFEGLDPQKRGFIEGDVAVPFMLQSKLSEDVLAQIWDLSDLNNDGRLTRDEFAVAWHLIQGKLVGKEVPSSIPESLIPPSMRNSNAAPAAPPASEAIRDLLWDDTPPASASPAANVQAQPTGSFTAIPPQSTGKPSQPPTEAFAVRSTSPATAARIPNALGGQYSTPVHRDLLGDDEEVTVASPPLPDNSAEIGNVQNQLNSTNKSLETTKTDRQNAEQALANQAGQLSALQTQLASAKAAYETETRLLSTLRERFATQSTEIQESREELIRAESNLSAVRVEKSEIEGSFMRDKEEVRDLQRKMKGVGDEIEQTKVGVEKAKKDAKQQKGLLAIARKQLSTRDAERARVAKELEEAEAEAATAAKEREAAEAELAIEPESTHTNGDALPPHMTRMDTATIAAGQPLPSSPNVASPLTAHSTGSKSNNPFERLVMASGSSTPRATSPFQSLTSDTSDAASTIAAPKEQANSDPFGFNDSFTETTPVPATNDQPSISQSSNLFLSEAASPTSPEDNDSIFKTPPTTAVPSAIVDSHESTQETNKSAFALDSAAAQFPPIESELPGHLPVSEDNPATEMDLTAPLKEIEHDTESDSDDDDDENYEDANTRLSTFGKPKASEDDPHTAVNTKDASGSNAANGMAASAAAPVISAFDDSFGQSTPISQSPALPAVKALSQSGSGRASPLRSQSPANVFSTRPASPQTASNDAFNPNSSKAATSFEPAAAGINDFDEAMGKIPGTNGDVQHQFKFDSSFDDNFDFASAGATNFPPVSTEPSFPPLANGVTAPTTAKSQNEGFDSAFGIEGKEPEHAPVAVTGSTAEKPLSFDDAFGSSPSTDAAEASKDLGISFEDAFGGGNGASQALAFDDTFKTAQTPAAVISQSGTVLPRGAAPFPSSPVAASPTSGLGSPTASRRSMSPPPRQRSPPPRTSSPKPRPSTGSSKDGSITDKPTPTARHSKLSIRLPFGKNKDKKRTKNETLPPPPPQTFLSPVAEPTGVATPAVEDDVEPVKQLCGMGFSRTQAVTALEKHGYDVQKALNSLLGIS